MKSEMAADKTGKVLAHDAMHSANYAVTRR